MNAKIKHIRALLLISTIPLILSIITSWIILFCLGKIEYKINDTVMIDIVKMMLGIWGTLLGFIITAVSILIGFNGSERTKEIIESRHYKTILYTYMITCFVLLLSIATFVPVVIINSFNYMWFLIFLTSLLISLIYVFLCLLYLTLIITTALKKKL